MYVLNKQTSLLRRAAKRAHGKSASDAPPCNTGGFEIKTSDSNRGFGNMTKAQCELSVLIISSVLGIYFCIWLCYQIAIISLSFKGL